MVGQNQTIKAMTNYTVGQNQTKAMTHLWPESRARQRRILNAYEPLTDDNIKEAAQHWVSNPSNATSRFGAVDTWNVSQVTNLESVWCGGGAPDCGGYTAMQSFNGDISKWDVSKVTTMQRCKL